MTVKELIEELNRIEDKNKQIIMRISEYGSAGILDEVADYGDCELYSFNSVEEEE